MAKNEADRLFEEGYDFYAAGKYREALDVCDKALAIDPYSLLASCVWTQRGLVLLDLGRHQEAVESFDNAIAIWPNNEVSWSSRASALLLLSLYQEAVESCDKALELDPDLTPALEAKQKALEKLDEWFKKRKPFSLYTEIYEQVTRIEARLHIFIKQRLQKEIGKEEAGWLYKGIPEDIRTKCFEIQKKDPKYLLLYNYVYFIDLKEIIDKQWKFFDTDFQRIKTEFKSKKEFLDSLVRLNEIRKSVMHWPRGSLTLSEEDLKLARHMREVIEQFCGPG